MRIQARKQGRPRGAAAAFVIKLGEVSPTGGYRVQVRRGDLTAIAAEV